MDKTILVVEDNEAIRRVIEEFLLHLIDTENVKIVTTDKESRADEVLRTEDVSLVITDVNLGVGGDGLAIVDELNKKDKRPYIILMSSIEWLKNVKEYIESGRVDTFLNKPFSYNDLKIKLLHSNAVSLK
jgi:DNA-binding NtrC family response regulator